MARAGRSFVQRTALAAIAIAGALTCAACGAVLGIDPGIPKDDGSDGAAAADDATTVSDAAHEGSGGLQERDVSDAARASDASESGADSRPEADAGGDAAPDARADADATGGDAASDASADADATSANANDAADGQAVDGRDATSMCATNCPPSWVCDKTTHQCACQRDPTWCNGRCGISQDNCGATVDCGTCGCSPQPDPCGNRQCGQVLDSCGHPATCGVHGACPGAGVCNNQTGTCCAPNPQCGASCNVIVSDECGSSVMCACSGGDVCYRGQCCSPVGGCSPDCIDNCGQPTACCPEAGSPPDGGMGSDDGGCSGPGSTCPAGQGCCPGLSCTATGTCMSACSTGSCSTLADCCFGFTACGQGAGIDAGFGPVPIGLGMCQ